MFRRKALDFLKEWKVSAGRKPLVLRGARQVGKTSLIKLFAEEFDFFISVNLERDKEREVFENSADVQEVFDALCFLKNIKPKEGKSVLLFIDEIQVSSRAVSLLRYFYEDMPRLHIVAAGSLLETLLDKQIHFPVGRVEFYPVRPVSFMEFLEAMGEQQAKELIQGGNIPGLFHDRLMSLFRQYTLLGGMPEVVAIYARSRQFSDLVRVYDGLLTTYLDDVLKYARSEAQGNVLRHCIESSFYEAGNRIRFVGFGKSNYKSREIGEALRILEKTMLLQLVYPLTSTQMPLLPDKRKSPRLMVLDVGLMMHFSGIHKDMMRTNLLHGNFEGKVNEIICGQELLAMKTTVGAKINFWTREKRSSDAELDYVHPWQGLLVPVEVKSGKTGRLRSLHLFMDESPHDIAVRVYSGPFSVEDHRTISGRAYRLINLPFYLINQLDRVLEQSY